MRARLNPFAMDLTEALAFRFPSEEDRETQWKSKLERLQELSYRGLVIGKKGSGKTTFLYELQGRLEQQGKTCHLVRLRPTENPRKSRLNAKALLRSLETLSKDTVLLLDSAGLLSPGERNIVFRKSRRLLGTVTTLHRRPNPPTLIQRRFRSSAPAPPVWMEIHSTRELLEELARELVQSSPEKVQALVDTQDLGDLFERHQGNLRLCLRELYDLVGESSR